MYLESYHCRLINYVISSQLIDTANAFTRNPEKSISGNNLTVGYPFANTSSYTCQSMMSSYFKKGKKPIRFYLIFALEKHTTHNSSDLSQEFVTQLGSV